MQKRGQGREWLITPHTHARACAHTHTHTRTHTGMSVHRHSLTHTHKHTSTKGLKHACTKHSPLVVSSGPCVSRKTEATQRSSLLLGPARHTGAQRGVHTFPTSVAVLKNWGHQHRLLDHQDRTATGDAQERWRKVKGQACHNYEHVSDPRGRTPAVQKPATTRPTTKQALTTPPTSQRGCHMHARPHAEPLLHHPQAGEAATCVRPHTHEQRSLARACAPARTAPAAPTPACAA